jgi:hypothetical protein
MSNSKVEIDKHGFVCRVQWPRAGGPNFFIITYFYISDVKKIMHALEKEMLQRCFALTPSNKMFIKFTSSFN